MSRTTSSSDDDLGELVRRAVAARAASTPDPGAVFRRAEACLDRRRRRRRHAAAVGGASLAVAGLVGGISVLGDIGASSRLEQVGTQPVAPPPPRSAPDVATVSPPPSDPMAVDLTPSSAPCLESSSDLSDADYAALETFPVAGYTIDDAWALAALWDQPCGDAKIAAGRALQAGQDLPVAPGTSGIHLDPDPAAEAAFVDAGYDAGDAAELAAYWGYTDPQQAKIKAGRYMLAGRQPPVTP